MDETIFESSIRTSGDLAAIFEYDREGGYFYLFDLTKEEGQQARAVIEVSTHGVALHGADVLLRWNASEDIAGLCIGGDLWAAFDQHGARYGGSFGAQDAPSIPPDVISRFNSVSEQNLSAERRISAERR